MSNYNGILTHRKLVHYAVVGMSISYTIPLIYSILNNVTEHFDWIKSEIPVKNKLNLSNICVAQ